MRKAPKSILNKEFQYVNSANTNVAKTFQRVRAQLKQDEEERKVKVEPIRRKA